jgi:hypothetical protein
LVIQVFSRVFGYRITRKQLEIVSLPAERILCDFVIRSDSSGLCREIFSLLRNAVGLRRAL